MEELTAMFRVCNATKNDGVRCGSPALTGANFCFQHIGGNVRALTRARATTSAPSAKLKLVFPGDRQAIQHNLFLVAQALNDGKIDTAAANTFNRLYRACEQNLRHWEKDHDGDMLPLPDETPEAGAGAPGLEETWGNNQVIPTEPGLPQPALSVAKGTGLHPSGAEATTAADSQADDEEDESKRRYREWKQSPEGQAYQRTWGKLDSDFNSRLATILDPNTDSDTAQPGRATHIHAASSLPAS